MNFGACVGLPESIAVNIRDEGYQQNHYAGKDFFEDENFRAALERMNEDTIRSAKQFARIDDQRCDYLQTIISEYRTLIDQTYIRVNFGHRYEHRRMREFKKLFKIAHATLAKSKGRLDKLSAQKTRIEQALLQVDKTLEEEVMTEKKRINKVNVQSKYEIELKILDECVVHAKRDHTDAKRMYRNKAKEIFSECQQIERQRLEQIREILLKFIQMMHTRNYTTEIEQIYDELISNVTTQQNSLDDLAFWAKTYGILDDEQRLPISSTITESIARGNDLQQVETDIDEEESSTQ